MPDLLLEWQLYVLSVPEPYVLIVLWLLAYVYACGYECWCCIIIVSVCYMLHDSLQIADAYYLCSCMQSPCVWIIKSHDVCKGCCWFCPLCLRIVCLIVYRKSKRDIILSCPALALCWLCDYVPSEDALIDAHGLSSCLLIVFHDWLCALADCCLAVMAACCAICLAI